MTGSEWEVTDSSLCVMLLFSHLRTLHLKGYKQYDIRCCEIKLTILYIVSQSPDRLLVDGHNKLLVLNNVKK